MTIVTLNSKQTDEMLFVQFQDNKPQTPPAFPLQQLSETNH